MGLPFLLTDLLSWIPKKWYHRILSWLGIDQQAYHEWLEGFCTCGYIGDYDEEDAT